MNPYGLLMRRGRVAKTDLAYFAGLIDGEGSFVWNVRGSSIGQPCVKIYSTYRPVLEWVLKLVPGGSIENHADETRTTNFGGTKPCYAWSVSGMRAILVARNTLPYLIIKHDRAIELIQQWDDSFALMRRPGRRRQAAKTISAEFRGLGWSV